MADDDTLTLFVSHHSTQIDLALAIERALAERGIKCWIAPRDVPPGEPFDRAIQRAIDNAAGILLLLSKKSDISRHVKRELILADSIDKPIIPLRLEMMTPTELRYFLADSQWIDWSDKDAAVLDALANQAQLYAKSARNAADTDPADDDETGDAGDTATSADPDGTPEPQPASVTEADAPSADEPAETAQAVTETPNPPAAPPRRYPYLASDEGEPTKSKLNIFLAIILGILLLFPAALIFNGITNPIPQEAPRIPRDGIYAEDFGGLIDAALIAELDRKLRDFQAESGVYVHLEIRPTMAPHDEDVEEAADMWRILRNADAMIYVVGDDEMLAIVGEELDETFTTETERAMIAHFEAGRLSEGLNAGVDAVIAELGN